MPLSPACQTVDKQLSIARHSRAYFLLSPLYFFLTSEPVDISFLAVNKSLDNIKSEVLAIFERQKSNRRHIKSTLVDERLGKLHELLEAIESRSKELKQAVYADLSKSGPETLITELYPIKAEITHVMENLREWMAPELVGTPVVFAGSRSETRREAKGVVLIVSPWNYPFNLAIGPLVSAIAAGNTAIVKPSELAPHTSRFVKELLSGLFDEKEVAVVEGDHRVAQFLVELPFDHIFFTGSPTIGRKVMASAAPHLTSVSLELGGKSAVIIDASADLKEAAAKIAWGKTINAGQSCVAPDYVLLPKKKETRFIELLKASFEKRYGSRDGLDGNPDYGRIINLNHFRRIKTLVDSAVGEGAKIEAGGMFHEEDCFISPTIVSHVPRTCSLMQEEIFGPVLPVVSYEDLSEAINFVNSKPPPLALYIFSRSDVATETILNDTSSGDAVVNDVVVHFGHARLPFGGTGESGLGKAHGRAGFEAFSHRRSVLRQPKYTMASSLYPPYTRLVQWLIRFTIKYL